MKTFDKILSWILTIAWGTICVDTALNWFAGRPLEITYLEVFLQQAIIFVCNLGWLADAYTKN